MIKTKIEVETVIAASLEKVWKSFTEPEDVKKWNFASDDWHSPHAENDLRVGGTFRYTMASKDGKVGFDFVGTYTNIIPKKKISYDIGDGREVTVEFSEEGNNVRVTETFEAEEENSVEQQKGGWQAILNNFKKYVESK